MNSAMAEAQRDIPGPVNPGTPPTALRSDRVSPALASRAGNEPANMLIISSTRRALWPERNQRRRQRSLVLLNKCGKSSA